MFTTSTGSGVVPGLPLALDGWSHVNTGKVRDLYVPQDAREYGAEVMMLVASDRISAFERIMSPVIPDKGRILTSLTLWWFEQLGPLIPHHVISTEVPGQVAERAMICRHLTMYPVECIVRGYLTPVMAREYELTGAFQGVRLPPWLDVAEKLPEPIFTPARKAELGYGGRDEAISFKKMASMIGKDKARRLRDHSIRLYEHAAKIAADRGVILAATKFEFGASVEAGGPDVVLGDEVLTPDSSRFWFADEWQESSNPQPLDKQAILDWLDSPESGWDSDSELPPPVLPDEVVEETRRRYVRVYEQLTGRRWE